jgi:SAM-dependent methyltransferase
VPWRSAPAAEPGFAPVALRRCPRCGTAVTAAAATDGMHDSGAYGPGDPRLSRAAAPALAAFDRQRLALVAAAIAPPARLLDAGAGRGRFVAAARAAGYAARGLEPSARGIAAARDHYDVVLDPGGVEDAAILEASIDVVTLWHVLEHVADPDAALARIAVWLRPGGALVVGVPNLRSCQARLGGRRWFHLDLPRHRTHFTVTGLRALLERHGFTVESERHVLAEHNPFGMWQSLVSRLTRRPSYLYQLLKRNAPARSPDLAITLLALPLVPAAAALELLAGLARRGGTVAVTARRNPPAA